MSTPRHGQRGTNQPAASASRAPQGAAGGRASAARLLATTADPVPHGTRPRSSTPPVPSDEGKAEAEGGGKAPNVAAPAKEGRGEDDRLSELPDEVLRRVMLFLDVDSAAHCGMIAHRWRLVLDDKIYQAFCERTYLDQCQVKLLNPSRFGGWLGMLISRPRLRTNGFYLLMSAYIKKPVKDMWTEITPGTILEVKYFRYFRFLPQGRLLYMLTHASPPDAIRMFKEGRHKELCEGQYFLSKGEVHCRVQTHYSTIIFRLELQNGSRGQFTQLLLQEHSSVPHTDPSGTPIPHRVTFETFQYQRVPIF